MDRVMLYLIGAPGAGKTTLMNKVLEGCPYIEEPKPFAVRWYPKFGGPCQLGRARPDFGGTDTLSMGVQPLVLDWLKCGFTRTVIGEGDRLGNERFFRAVKEEGWNLTIIYLDTSPDLTRQRCEGRGSTQNEAWMAGRRTKVQRLASKFSHWNLDGTHTVDELASQLRQHTAIQRIRNT